MSKNIIKILQKFIIMGLLFVVSTACEPGAPSEVIDPSESTVSAGTALLTGPLVPPMAPKIWNIPAEPTTGRRIQVSAGESLQEAIDRANPGDIIELQAGATYTGSFRLRDKGDSRQWIVIRTKGFDIPEGQRVMPDDATKMARIETGGIEDFITDENKANHYRFVGIELLAQGVTKRIFDLGNRGTRDKMEQSHHIIIDRCYIHAEDSAWVKTAVRLNGRYMAVVNSHISNITFRRLNDNNFEAQAISGQNGAGPFKIVNNFLQAAGINFIYGGGATPIPEVPSDFEIRRNHFHKKPEWKEQARLHYKDPNYLTVKNLLELKTGVRVLIDGNIFENSWAAHDQKGYAIGLKQKTTEGDFHDLVQDITITNNIIKSSNYAVAISPRNVNISRVKIENNLGLDIHHRHGVITGDARGWAFGLSSTPWANEQYIFINHNTILNTPKYGVGIKAFTSKRKHGEGIINEIVTITNNFYTGPLEGDDDCIDTGCTRYFSNLIYSENGSWSPDIFVNYTGDLSGDYHLKNPAQHVGTDGKTRGADMDAILAATGLQIPAKKGQASLE